MSMWVWFLFGIGTGIIITKLASAYMNVGIEAEKKAILIELVKTRKSLIEYNNQLEEKIRGMKR